MNLTPSNRSFSAIANTNHWAPMAGYGWSQNIVLTGQNGSISTGGWIPNQLDANGNLLTALTNATVSGSFTVDNTTLIAAITTGNVYDSGILTSLQTGVPVTISNSSPIAVSGNLTSSPSVYTKVSSTGYVSGFSPFGGSQIIKGVQGYSKCSSHGGFGFLQIFDGATLIEPVAVQSGQNFYVDFAENGVTFNNFNIINALDPVAGPQYNTGDFFAVVVYR